MSARNTAELDPWLDLDFDAAELQRLLDEPVPPEDQTTLRTNPQHAGFDSNVGDSWIYPSNLPQRAYQYAITQTALYRNTLVVLPTGLGKTFIAAVVMYNMYRWYPLGKVIFMAPTRPLVNQQIEACQRIMPFPNRDTVELTGKLQRKARAELWRTKRVFFATPQVVQSDICSRTDDDVQFDFPFDQIKLIVIDEAHKAKGKYAYTEVAQAIWQRNPYHRVLALSATPGRTTEDVAAVVRNLFISHVEVRCENSVDVMPYIHKRSMKTVVVQLSSEIKEVREELIRIIDPYLRQLIDAEVLSGSHRNINRNFLLFEQKKFRERSLYQQHSHQAAVNSNFSICISLHHALELLERHGLRAFLNNFEEDDEGRSKFILNMDGRLRKLVERLRLEVGPNPFDVSAQAMTNGKIAEMPAELDFGHPKFEEARKCLLEHFQAHADSRAIVFCEYRESVMLIYRLLLQHVPLLKPRCFVGQGGTTGSFRALTQKQQLQVMNDFRAGTSNILVATSVGEEGIDVGEVELIVCFDISTANPTRFIQRIGRTGRKKNGRVVMLVTEGREQQLMKDVLATKDLMNKKITRSSLVQAALYKNSPRLVPTELNPTCLHTFIKPPDEEEQGAQGKTKKQTKTTKVKRISASQDLRKFFTKQKAPVVQLDAEDMQVFQTNTRRAPSKSNESDMPVIANSRPVASSTLSARKPIETKRLRRINKLLKSNTPLLTASQRKEDLASQLNSALLSRELKLLLIKQHQAYVNEVYQKMQVLLALELEIEADAMSEEERDIRATYESLLGLFLNNAAIARYLDGQNSPDVDECLYSDSEDVCPVSDGNFQRCFETVFKGFDVQGRNRDNYDYIQAEFMKTEYYVGLMEPEEQSEETSQPTIDEEELSEWCSNDFTADSITDSKYCSQWDQLGQSPSSAPNVKGPLVNAFNRQRNKAELSKSKEAEKKKNNSGIMDFDDDDDVLFLDEEVLLGKESPSFESKVRSDALRSTATPKVKPVMYNSSTPLNELRKFKEPIETSPIVKNLRTLMEVDSSLFSQEAEKCPEVSPEDSLRPDSAMKLNSSFSTAEQFMKDVEQPLKAASHSKPIPSTSSPKMAMNQFSSPGVARATPAISSTSTPNDKAVFMTKSSTPLLGRNSNFETKTQATTATAKTLSTKTTDVISSTKTSSSSSSKILPTTLVTRSSGSRPFAPTPIPSSTTITAAPISTTSSAIRTSTAIPNTSSASIPIPSSSSRTSTAIPITTSPTAIPHHKPPTVAPTNSYNILSELDFDEDAFLEPFPEEIMATEALTANSGGSTSSHKENAVSNNNINTPSSSKRNSPDIFAVDEVKPSPKTNEGQRKMSLAAKLAAKRTTATTAKTVLPSKSAPAVRPSANTAPISTPSTAATSPLPKESTPPPIATANSCLFNYKRSPSLFDMYLQNNRQRSSRILHQKRKPAPSSPKSSTTLRAEVDESIIGVVPRKTSKRKIFESDSEHETVADEPMELDVETDCEEIAATQKVEPEERILTQRKKRRRMCEFIEHEAEASGSDEDELEETVGHYVCDSVIVQSSDEEEHNFSPTENQAIYLKSLKSPPQRPGAFKIPAYRVFNDRSRIFSQMAPAENSQYADDSFVVHENEQHENSAEQTLCPLEKAEKILAERRRIKRQLGRLSGMMGRRTKRKFARLHMCDEDD